MSDIPEICFVDDLARLLRTSRRTIETRVQHGTFPIPTLPSIDKRHRWSGDVVRRFLSGETQQPATRQRFRRVG